MVTEKDNPQSNRLVSSFLIGISTSVFAAVAYYFGRKYIEGYYQGLGIPTGMLHFDTIEYIYSSVTSLTIFLALLIALFTYGIVKLLLVLVLGRDWSIWDISTKNLEYGFAPISKRRLFNLYSKICFWALSIIYFALFIVILLINISIPEVQLKNMLQFLYVYPCLLYGFYLAQDPNVISIFSQFSNTWKPISRYKQKNKIKWRQIFSLILLISLLYIFYTTFSMPSTWGQAKGINDWTNATKNTSDNTNTALTEIVLITNKQDYYPGITWLVVSDNISNNLYKSDDRLILILRTDTELFVRGKNKDRTSEIFIVKVQDIVAIKSVD